MKPFYHFIPRGIIIPVRLMLIVLSAGCFHSAKAQVTVAFQGGEPGDTWTYTTSGLGATVASETASGPKYQNRNTLDWCGWNNRRRELLAGWFRQWLQPCS